jgi:hypothetical protein
MGNLFYCFYKLVDSSDSMPHFTAYVAISCTSYMNLLVLSTFLEEVVGIKVIPDDMSKLGVVLSATPILIVYFFLFLYKKKYLDILEKYNKSTGWKTSKWVAIVYIVLSFILLVAGNEI